ncbi:hypothetical protein Barb6XT_00341 [Bacteroidales bacterium Barb6XT]|nr:hypothetical protein Barb6XT_00341 [Bacteroidales bacterium Barb6XT]
MQTVVYNAIHIRLFFQNSPDGIVPCVTPRAASLYVGLKSFALSWHLRNGNRRYPERMQDFSPTWSGAECGVTDSAVRKVLEERYKMQHIIFGRSFRTLLTVSFLV